MHDTRRGLRALTFLIALVALFTPARAQCPGWLPTFAPGGVNGSIQCSATFDDGNGPALYVAGLFSSVCGVPAANIARWDGTTWSALGSGTFGQIDRLTVWDDGSGPALYACGSFTEAGGAPANHIARWRAGAWSTLGAGPPFIPRAMVGFDDGTGPALYLGGSVQITSTVILGRMQRWNGSTWSAFGGDFYVLQAGANGSISDLLVHDDGLGPKLHVAGYFGSPAGGVARWTGTGWSQLGAGLPTNSAKCLLSFDDGSGPALYASYYPGVPGTWKLARWSGGAWTEIANGTNSEIRALVVHDDGSGPALHACGAFTTIGGTPAAQIARWSGSLWSPLASGINTPGSANTLASLALSGTPRLFCGGTFSAAGGTGANRLAQWSSGTWSAVGPTSAALNSYATALAVHDDGAGPSLFAAGHFTAAGTAAAARVGRWDGTQWHALAAGLDAIVNCLTRHDEGGGPMLYAGGAFTNSGATPVSRVARWDGSSWSAVGPGLGNTVLALCSFDDGSGPVLCAGGNFAGGVARWDGSSWSPMGAGFNTAVQAFAVWDDGSGPKLYAGGGFTTLGGNPIGRVVRWDGTNWSSVGPVGGWGGSVWALLAHDDGSGSRLFAGGNLTLMGSAGLAAWNGASWMTVGGTGISGGVEDLTAWDDGSGVALYAGGNFTNIGALTARGIARWDGVSWSALAGSFDSGQAAAIAAYQAPASTRADLFVAGTLQSVAGVPAVGITHWRGCGHPGTVACAGDGSGSACPCANSGLVGHGCDNSAATGGAVLDADGWNSLTFDSLSLTSSGQVAFGLSLFVQGDQQLAPTAFGDGLLCAGGNLKRLYLKVASGGTVVAPGVGDASVSTRSLLSGDPIAVGSTRVYQVYYRDADLTFCTATAGSTFNLSNALRIGWTP